MSIFNKIYDVLMVDPWLTYTHTQPHRQTAFDRLYC